MLHGAVISAFGFFIKIAGRQFIICAMITQAFTADPVAGATRVTAIALNTIFLSIYAIHV